jgi:hypothetical protein
MHLWSSHLVQSPELIVTIDPNTSNVLRDIQDQLHLI